MNKELRWHDILEYISENCDAPKIYFDDEPEEDDEYYDEDGYYIGPRASLHLKWDNFFRGEKINENNHAYVSFSYHYDNSYERPMLICTVNISTIRIKIYNQIKQVKIDIFFKKVVEFLENCAQTMNSLGIRPMEQPDGYFLTGLCRTIEECPLL